MIDLINEYRRSIIVAIVALSTAGAVALADDRYLKAASFSEWAEQTQRDRKIADLTAEHRQLSREIHDLEVELRYEQDATKRARLEERLHHRRQQLNWIAGELNTL